MIQLRIATARTTLPANVIRNVRYKSTRGGLPTMEMPAIKPQQSHRIAAKELGELPPDMGLLSGSFVPTDLASPCITD